jgi:hypothetical protein
MTSTWSQEIEEISRRHGDFGLAGVALTALHLQLESTLRATRAREPRRRPDPIRRSCRAAPGLAGPRQACRTRWLHNLPNA